MLRDVVGAGTEELDQVDFWYSLGVGWKPEERCVIGCAGNNICSILSVLFGGRRVDQTLVWKRCLIGDPTSRKRMDAAPMSYHSIGNNIIVRNLASTVA